MCIFSKLKHKINKINKEKTHYILMKVLLNMIHVKQTHFEINIPWKLTFYKVPFQVEEK